jgi:hypothetical protein
MHIFTRSIQAATVALALLACSGVQAQTANPTEAGLPQFMAMADKNKDKMLSKEEFMGAMGQMYDAAVKKAKDSGKGMKGELMLPETVRQMLEDLARLSKGA